jgi:hypothetical protein
MPYTGKIAVGGGGVGGESLLGSQQALCPDGHMHRWYFLTTKLQVEIYRRDKLELNCNSSLVVNERATRGVCVGGGGGGPVWQPPG